MAEDDNELMSYAVRGAAPPGYPQAYAATVRAAIRRGCVCPINPFTPRLSSRQIFGICVVLPDPVSPETITT